MVNKITILTSGDNPTVISEGILEGAPSIKDFPENCFAFIKKTYEGQLFGTIHGNSYKSNVVCNGASFHMHIDVKMMLREVKSNPIYRKYIETKKIGNIITEILVMICWTEETKDGGRILNSYSLEYGYFDKDEYDINGNLKKMYRYNLDGSSAIYSYENGVENTYKHSCSHI